jgi:hypothetical protein
MSDTPWTPGPWVAVCADDEGEHERNWRIEAPDGGADPWLVAETQFFPQPGMEEANARLIQHAPEMAEALEPFANVTILPSGAVVGLDRAWFDNARTLLSRIRGDAA